MSTSIDTVTITGIEDRRLVLSNAEAARYINIGTSWTRLRLGIRLSLDDIGIDLAGNPRLNLGVISSPSASLSNGYLTNSTSHFVGFGNTLVTVQRFVGGGNNCYLLASGAASNSIKKKIGTTSTSSSISPALAVSLLPATVRNVVIVEITKGSPNFTVAYLGPDLNPLGDITALELSQAMSISLLTDARTYLSSLGKGTYLAPVSGTIAVDEGTDGSLNAIDINWNRIDSLLHISDFYWAKMA